MTETTHAQDAAMDAVADVHGSVAVRPTPDGDVILTAPVPGCRVPETYIATPDGLTYQSRIRLAANYRRIHQVTA